MFRHRVPNRPQTSTARYTVCSITQRSPSTRSTSVQRDRRSAAAAAARPSTSHHRSRRRPKRHHGHGPANDGISAESQLGGESSLSRPPQPTHWDSVRQVVTVSLSPRHYRYRCAIILGESSGYCAMCKQGGGLASNGRDED